MNASSRTRIKICGLTREADVDAAVEAGTDAIGFVMYPRSPRHVAPARAAELALRLPPFITPVLLFVNADASEVQTAVRAVPGALLQFHGDETPSRCAELASAVDAAWLRAARIPADASAGFDLIKFTADFSAARAILLDAQVEGYGGGGKTFDWSLLPPSVNAHLVLSGGLTPENVGDGIRLLRRRGRSLAVDISSGVEIDGPGNKGLKDAAKIQRFVAAVRAADAHPD